MEPLSMALKASPEVRGIVRQVLPCPDCFLCLRIPSVRSTSPTVSDHSHEEPPSLQLKKAQEENLELRKESLAQREKHLAEKQELREKILDLREKNLKETMDLRENYLAEKMDLRERILAQREKNLKEILDLGVNNLAEKMDLRERILAQRENNLCEKLDQREKDLAEKMDLREKNLEMTEKNLVKDLNMSHKNLDVREQNLDLRERNLEGRLSEWEKTMDLREENLSKKLSLMEKNLDEKLHMSEKNRTKLQQREEYMDLKEKSLKCLHTKHLSKLQNRQNVWRQSMEDIISEMCITKKIPAGARNAEALKEQQFRSLWVTWQLVSKINWYKAPPREAESIRSEEGAGSTPNRTAVQEERSSAEHGKEPENDRHPENLKNLYTRDKNQNQYWMVVIFRPSDRTALTTDHCMGSGTLPTTTVCNGLSSRHQLHFTI
ncbi:hypothetical protein NFI96_007076 [Prochilodus magdalenae]|nr:hypothetical protein NFI96_007076 [Prochilodus magdalenae]